MSKYLRLLSAGLLISLLVSVVAVVGDSVSVSTAYAAPGQTYEVKPGDYLLAIANKLQVSLDDLLDANGLTKKSVIHPGDELIVPAGGVLPGGSAGSGTAAKDSGLVYEVKAGDYLRRIARTINVSLDDLLSVNGLTKSSVIHPGDKLKIPAGGSVPTGANPRTSATPTASPPAVGSKVATVLAFTQAQLGDPYQKFASGPDTWDCSGLTMRAYQTVGIKLPHYSGAQVKYGKAVDWKVAQILPGDLVFLETRPGSGVIGHVGIATGADTWTQAPRTGDVVREGKIPFYRVFAVRRLVNG